MAELGVSLRLRFEIGMFFHHCEMPQNFIRPTCLEEHVL